MHPVSRMKWTEKRRRLSLLKVEVPARPLLCLLSGLCEQVKLSPLRMSEISHKLIHDIHLMMFCLRYRVNGDRSGNLLERLNLQ